jgi:hypothetical protein
MRPVAAAAFQACHLESKTPAKAGVGEQHEAVQAGRPFIHFLRGGSALSGICGAVLMTGRGSSSGTRLRIVSSSKKNFSASIATTSLAEFLRRAD